MQIQYFQGGNFIEAAFYNPLVDDFDIDIISASATQIVAVNPGTGVVTTFTGTGFPALPFPPLPGTLTGMSMVDAGGNPLATITGISWGLQATLTALEQAVGNDALGLLRGLLSLQDITLDASGAVAGIAGLDFTGVTSDITVVGSDFVDDVFGGAGNDTINGGGDVPGNDEADLIIHGSLGDDTLDFSDLVSGSDFAFSAITYDGLSGPIVLTFNQQTNTGTVEKGLAQGTDTFVNLNNLLVTSADLYGTASADTFNLNVTSTFILLFGGLGSDSFNLTMNEGSTLIWDSRTFTGGPTQGVVFNATTGVIANDGYGFAETLTLIREGDVNASTFGINATGFDDNITGSTGRDRLRVSGGNDTLDGGDGFDVIQFNRTPMNSGVTLDMLTNTATGAWNGVAFTITLSNVEEVIGSRFNDTIRGNAVANTLTGDNGADLLEGRDGADFLQGGAGNDTLIGGQGQDRADGGDGDDTIIVDRRWFDDIYGGTNGATGDLADFALTGSGLNVNLAFGIYSVGGINYALQGIETLVMGNGRDIVTGSDGAETIISGGKRDQIDAGLGDDTIDAGGGTDVVFARLGNDATNGGADVDTLDFSALSAGVVYSTATGVSDSIGTHLNYESVICGSGNDQITGGDNNDTIRGNAGNDRLTGGRGADSLVGLSGSDTLSGEGGNDTLTGGAFADHFVFVRVASAGSDLVTDFGNGADRLSLDDALWTGVLTTAQVVSTFASVVNGDVIFDFGSRGSFTLDGVTSTAGLDTRIDII